MKRELFITEDGSHTLFIPEMDEHYHSVHGAIQESKHVFIESGLKQTSKEELTIFEVGLGTGLNALLTLMEADKSQQKIHYIGVEKYPLQKEEYTTLNYSAQTGFQCNPTFMAFHEAAWGEKVKFTANFWLTKIKADLATLSFDTLPLFDLVYFDAFAPNKQQGLWEQSIFEKIYLHCNAGALLVTYCAKGSVRRDLEGVGFRVERIPGPPGKREMIRAIK
jgi:tRNA U34 5-methylaminomethyl-2-thiouridine-forming methyltransferase MnmC